MKTFFFILFITIYSFAFPQEGDKRGSIKVRRIVSDTNCTATLLGYSGRNFISRKELLKAKCCGGNCPEGLAEQIKAQINSTTA